MSVAWVECWKCDECGFRWIKGKTIPERCASSKCRKRSWNKAEQPTVMRRYIRSTPTDEAPVADSVLVPFDEL